MAPNVDYVFNRDFLDINRWSYLPMFATGSMNLLHHFWTKTLCYVIPPNIPRDGIRRVADVGTGTAIWLFDAREHLPDDAQLVGFDISFDAAPPREVLPSNVRLQHWDAREAIPDGLERSFDVIHLRFLAFVLLNDEIPGVISRLFQMLKPGGYIQWDEADMETLRFDKARTESKTENLEALYRLLEARDPRLKPTWANHLPELFSEAGFVDVEKDTKDAPQQVAFQFHDVGLIIHELIARKLQDEQMASELRRLLPAAVAETKNAAYRTSLRFSVIARKP
ncbi:uncharacterized protein PG986_005902 [Apiospora aurea]|uniref:Methyltransferase domain-containing protein n=1 Tax=Apiospora aurea TaxID=335848 RepID=A0ABR1QJ36_9PEZI